MLVGWSVRSLSRHRDRQRDRQIASWTDRQIARQTDRNRER